VTLSECEDNADTDILVEMFDAGGNKVYSKVPVRDFDGSFTFNIDTHNNLKPGIYIVRGHSSRESYSKKVVVG